MATNFPGSADSFTNPTASDSLDSATVPHATQHANVNDAVEAIEAEFLTGVTNPLLLPDGSAAAPSLTNTGDPNTGLYFPAADSVALATGGVLAQRWGVGYSEMPSSSSGLPYLAIRNTNTDAQAGSLYLEKVPTDNALADGDIIGTVFFRGVDTGGTVRTAAYIQGQADATNGATYADGRIKFITYRAGVASTKMQIDGDGLITGSGSLGNWTDYSSSLTVGGTGWALGDATKHAYYCQIGKVVYYKGLILWGSTSTYGAGQVTVNLPVTADKFPQEMGFAMFNDAGTANYRGVCYVDSSATTATFWATDTSGSYAKDVAVTSSVPHTWTTSDQLWWTLVYEAA